MSEELAKKLQFEEENKGKQSAPRYFVFTYDSRSHEENKASMKIKILGVMLGYHGIVSYECIRRI